jgi:hypothetical protein
VIDSVEVIPCLYVSQRPATVTDLGEAARQAADSITLGIETTVTDEDEQTVALLAGLVMLELGWYPQDASTQLHHKLGYQLDREHEAVLTASYSVQ